MFLLTGGLALMSADLRAADPPKDWEFTGRTQAVATVEVRSRATGYLTHVAVKEGAAVKKGDLLVEIFPRPYQLDLDAARARMRAAEAKLRTAKITAENSKKLTQKRVVSPNELALQEAAEAEAEAGLEAAKVEVARAELNLAGTHISAPIDGRVSHIHFTEGNLIAANQTVILTIVATDPLYISFNVPEAIVLRLRRDALAAPGKLGVAVGFADEEGYPHPAKLDLIAPNADPATGTVRFRATVQNPKGLLSPGMSARVRLTPPPK